MSSAIIVIDPRGVEWTYWNCICPKHKNMFYRENTNNCLCPQCKTKLEPIEPKWITDGYIPKKNKFIQELQGVKQ